MTPMAIKAQWVSKPEVPSSVPEATKMEPVGYTPALREAHIHKRFLRKDRVGSHSWTCDLLPSLIT